MKRILGLIGIFVGIFALLISSAIIFILSSDKGQLLLPIKHTSATFVSSAFADFPQPLHVEGNKICDDSNSGIKLKGVMFPDPATLSSRNKLDKDRFANLISDIKGTGANVIRVPVQPDHWTADKDYLWRNLSPIVEKQADKVFMSSLTGIALAISRTVKETGCPQMVSQ